MKKLNLILRTTLLLMLLFIPNAKADKYTDAKGACEKFINAYETIRTLTRDEQKSLVRAMCEAEDDARNEIGRSAANRVESMVLSNLDQLKRNKESADRMVDDVLRDETFKDKWDELKSLKNRMNEVLQRMERITGGVKGGNNPAFAFMSKMGMEAHKAYFNINSSNGVSEFEAGGKRIDFITYNCECIEVKADNSSAASKGRDQAKSYRDIMNTNADAFNSLVSKDSRFAACKGKFKWALACYRYCPSVNDDGEVQSASLGWVTCDKE